MFTQYIIDVSIFMLNLPRRSSAKIAAIFIDTFKTIHNMNTIQHLASILGIPQMLHLNYTPDERNALIRMLAIIAATAIAGALLA